MSEPWALDRAALIDQHRQREEATKATYAAVVDQGRKPTVGKHEAKNHEHLRRVLAEADETCPRAADTIRWLLWHQALDAQLMATFAGCHDDPTPPEEKP